MTHQPKGEPREHSNPSERNEPMSTAATARGGANLIGLERVRQVSAEGWTPEHDDLHKHGELILAARSYLGAGTPDSPMSEDWPWEHEAWKPADRVRNLAKAGALIAAEIDRLQRAEASS